MRSTLRQVAGDLRRDPGLRQVRTNALLLTLAILFFKTRKRLPHDRWEFYDAADKSLTDAWVRHRMSSAEDYLPRDYLPDLLERLALSGMENGHVLFEREMLKKETRAVLAERAYTGREQDKEVPLFLRAAEDLIGVLVEQGPDRFGFLHLTFQEFYAARAIVHRSGDAARLIQRYWDHPDWREVWPLYTLAVQNDAAKLEHLFQTILASGDDLDARLFRPELACLRLAGLGGAPLPPAITPVLDWTTKVVKGATYPLFEIMDRLAAWERRLIAELRKALLVRLADDDGEVRRAAVIALAVATGDAEVLDALLAGLADDHHKVPPASAWRLSVAAGERAVRDALLTRLVDDNGEVRRAAAMALAGAVDEAKVRSALRLADDARGVRRAAAAALAATVGEAEVRAALLTRLADDKADVRGAAAEALAAAVGEAEVRAALLGLLGDDVFVRRAAAEALAAAVGEREVRDALLGLLGDDVWCVRWAAAEALAAAVGEREVRDALLARLADADEDVRRAATRTLAGAVGEREVRAALLARLGDADWSVRGAAARALAAAVGEAEVRVALLARLGDAEESEREAAAQALAAAVGEAEVRDALLARLGDRDVASAAAKVLGAGIIAEKFGLPAGEIDVVYP